MIFFAHLMGKRQYSDTKVTNNFAANRFGLLQTGKSSARVYNSSRSQIFIIALSTERQSGKGPAAELSNREWRISKRRSRL